MKTIVIIPSRLSATRLPGKPLLKINGLSIISHVFKKAEEANIGEVIRVIKKAWKLWKTKWIYANIIEFKTRYRNRFLNKHEYLSKNKTLKIISWGITEKTG